MATTCTGNKVTTRAVNDWHGGADGADGTDGAVGRMETGVLEVGVGGGGWVGERMESRE